MEHSESLRGGRLSAVAFALATIAIYAASVQIRGLLPGLAAPEVVAWGLALDLVVVVPVLYWLLLVRRVGWPAVSTAPVFLLSLGAASLVLPAAHREPLEVLGLLAVPVELSLLGFVGYKAWRGAARFRALRRTGAAGDDVLERLRRAAGEALDCASVSAPSASPWTRPSASSAG